VVEVPRRWLRAWQARWELSARSWLRLDHGESGRWRTHHRLKRSFRSRAIRKNWNHPFRLAPLYRQGFEGSIAR
jgi:hypothetical protein